MSRIKELLVGQLRDLLHAESQLTAALPQLAQAANHPKLKEAFEKHLIQTKAHVERLHSVFQLLDEEAEPKPCKAMLGLVEECEATMEEAADMDRTAADLALIAAAQRVEHYEIACYGTVHALARQLGAVEVAGLLSHTLGEEKSADFILTAISDPLLQQAAIEDGGNKVNLESVQKRGPVPARNIVKPEKMPGRRRTA